MEVAAVSAATGAIGPVLRKLAALRPSDFGEGERTPPPPPPPLPPPPEVSDIEFITAKLEEMQSVLAGLRGRDEADLDEHCKDWMVMARELSYDIDDDLMQQQQQQPTNRSKILEDLKVKVMDVSGRLCDKWKSTAELIPNAGKPVDQDPRGRFLHKDASELVGMDELKAELLELVLAQGEGAAVRFSSPHRRKHYSPAPKVLFKIMEVKMVTTARKLLERMPGVEIVFATVAGDVKDVLVVRGVGLDPLKLRSTLQRKVGPVQLMGAGYADLMVKVVIKVGPMARDAAMRQLAIRAVSTMAGLESIHFDLQREMMVVIGDVDPVTPIGKIRKLMGPAHLVSVGPAIELAAETKAKKTKTAASGGVQRADDGALKTVCFVGYAGAGKTALADVLHKAAEGGQFHCRAFVSVSPTPNITEILKAILSQVTNEPYHGTDDLLSNSEQFLEQFLVHQIWNFLSNRRYLVIVDDIWHWNEWGIIKQSLPNNSLRSRIIITTRSKDIAEECRTDNTDAFVYDIGFLNYRDVPGRSLRQYDILEMCYGMPLAVFCMSSAWAHAEQMQGSDGVGLKNLRAARRVEDGILSMPCMKPLADSLCRGYDNLPLHLKTLLLYCSIYRWRDTFEREILVRRWIAEGFVHEEEAAQCFFQELIRKDWIENHRMLPWRFRIHPVMLAFLRCKAQEDNFAVCLAFGSDVSSLCARSRTRRIRRLSLQHGHSDQVKISESDLELSHTRSLSVFDDASAVPFKRFQLLRVLDLEGTEDLEYAHLVEICGLPWLRYLGLKGTPITMIPSEIGELQHLETLDVRNTAIIELPWEAGLIWRSVRVFAGDMELSHGVSLPEGVCQDLKNRVPENCRERELLCIMLFDRFGMGAVPPHAGLFKVRGTHVHIPKFIKEHFAVLSSLDVSLCKLDDEHGDLQFLQEMPNLQALVLRLEALPREPVTIGGEGFARLESFYLECRAPWARFERGAMPSLKLLTFRFYAAPASDDLPSVGIAHLRSIQKVVFRCSPWYRPDGLGVAATIAAVRGEAQEHPNRVAVEVLGVGEKDAGGSTAGAVEAEAEESCAPGPSKACTTM